MPSESKNLSSKTKFLPSYTYTENTTEIINREHTQRKRAQGCSKRIFEIAECREHERSKISLRREMKITSNSQIAFKCDLRVTDAIFYVRQYDSFLCIKCVCTRGYGGFKTSLIEHPLLPHQLIPQNRNFFNVFSELIYISPEFSYFFGPSTRACAFSVCVLCL